MKKYLNWIKKNIFNEKEDDNKSEEKYREVTEKDTTHANNEDEISISHMDDLFWNAGKFERGYCLHNIVFNSTKYLITSVTYCL